MKSAIIVGATSGIGRELALLMAAAGWTVGATGRRTELLEQLHGHGIATAAFDATADDAAQRLEQLAARMGGVDMVVYCSGYGDLNPDLNTEIERRTGRLNVDAFTEVATWAYRYFAERGGGHLAAVTSVSGLRGGGAAPAYGASKAYQINYLEALRQRAAKDKSNVKVTDLRPGSVDTAMMKGEGHFWISTSARAAEVMFDALKRGRRVKYVTSRWAVVGLMTKLMPRALWERM